MKTEVRFDNPVSVALGPSKNVLVNVLSARQAAEVLFTKWPNKGGLRHLEARKMVMAALEDLSKSAAARKAFVDAAKEAEILIDAGD